MQASVGIATAELLRPLPPAQNSRQRAGWLKRLAVGGALLSRFITLITTTLNPLTYQVGNSVEFYFEGGWWAMTIKEITEGAGATTAERERKYLLSSMHFLQEHKVTDYRYMRVLHVCAYDRTDYTHFLLLTIGERRAAGG